MEKVRIVGVDPGVRALGLVVVDHFLGWHVVGGALILEMGRDKFEQIKKKFSGVFASNAFVIEPAEDVLTCLSERIDSWWFWNRKPDLAVIEKGVFMGYANEILLCAGWIGAELFRKGAAVEYVNPSTVKRVVLGNGRAGKCEVKDFVKRQLGLGNGDDIKHACGFHIWDAFLYAFYGGRVISGLDLK